MINKNQECDIISDLLPLYLEHKVSDETIVFIQEHLEECESCRKNLQFMDTSYEELFDESGRNRRYKQGTDGTAQDIGRKPYKKNRIFGKARGRLFVYGYLFFLFCWWIYIIACYI